MRTIVSSTASWLGRSINHDNYFFYMIIPFEGHPKRVFYKKLFRNTLIGLILGAVSLLGGMWGYHFFEQMSWIDSYLNAAMILSGMGPVTELKTEAGKLFAGTYALFSGIIFLFVMALIFAPIVHRAFIRWKIAE